MDGLRITGGSMRGRRLPLPPHDHRPTSSKARQAFFDIAGSKIPSSRFLDLFAGSGIFSIEALSRGAASATAVDASRKGIDALRRTATQFGVAVELQCITLPTALPRLASLPAFDVVYTDPPYDFAHYQELLNGIDANVPLAHSALVAIEHRSGPPPFGTESLTRLQLRKTAKYGSVSFTIFDVADDD